MVAKRLAVLFVLAALAGCSQDGESDPALDALRNRFLVASEPAEAMTVTAARELLPMREDAVVIGQVDSEEPIDDRQALFVIRELPEGDDHGGAGHDAANCPFCKRKRASAPIAVVQLLDDEGRVIERGPQELLGLQANDIVVVRGRLEIDQLGSLLVNAQEIYIKREPR